MSGKKTKLTFEEAVERLEEIVQDLESGQLGLSESLARYEEGIKHLKGCHKLLAAAERKIEVLAGTDEDGNAETQSFDDEAMSLEEKAESRGRRRSTRRQKPSKSEVDDVDDQPGLF